MGRGADDILYGEATALALRPELPETPLPAVPAEIYSDDRVHQISVDVAEILGSCSEIHLRDLDRCGWGGDMPADQIAWELESRGHSEVGALMDYPHSFPRHEAPGFECMIDADAAREWLSQARPALAKELGYA